MVRDIVADLVRLADKHGMTPRGVSRHKDLLAEVDLSPGDITEAVLISASHRAKAELEALLAKHHRQAAQAVCRFGLTEPQQAKEKGQTLKEPASKVRKAPERGKVTRGTIFGHSLAAILRWMGANSWDKEDAGVALASYGFGSISDSTIYIQMRAGKVGDATRGPVPELSKKEAKELLANSK